MKTSEEILAAAGMTKLLIRKPRLDDLYLGVALVAIGIVGIALVSLLEWSESPNSLVIAFCLTFVFLRVFLVVARLLRAPGEDSTENNCVVVGPDSLVVWSDGSRTSIQYANVWHIYHRALGDGADVIV